MKLDPNLFKKIGPTIRAVATAQAERLFKSEKNTEERAALVFAAIGTQVGLALYDLGLSIEQLTDIEPAEDIVAAMVKQGYLIDDIDVDVSFITGDEDEPFVLDYVNLIDLLN